MKCLLLFVCALAQVCSASFSEQELFTTAASKKKFHLTHDLVGLHKNLVEIESISGNEKEVGNWLAASLEKQGYNVEKQSVQKDPERFNVFAWPGETRDAKVLLTSHIDTVPPFLPYKYNKTGDLISGRGSADAKGSVAAQIVAVNDLLADGKIEPDDVAVLYVVGEEVGGAGMRKANDLDIHPQSIIFGEPTENKLVSGHKGTMQVVINATGKSGHSGYPWLGRSANEVLVRALEPLITLGLQLPESDKYGYSTFNLGRIEGGVAANVIAETASAQVAVRIAEGTPETIEGNVTKVVHAAVASFVDGNMTVNDVVGIDFSGKGYGPIDLDYDVPGLDVITVNYGTDVPWFNTTKEQKRYLYGPGTILVAHSADEKITLEQLKGGVDGYKKIVLHALGKGPGCEGCEGKTDL